MQIFEKYRKDYSRALEMFKRERCRFKNNLDSIDGLRVLDSASNFFMIELLGSKNSRQVTREMLNKYGILIKDLKNKLGKDNYVRIAIRDEADNDKLCLALRDILNR